MIRDEIMAEIRYSFQTGADNETLIFNDEEEKNRFWEWFQNEAEQYTISDSPNTTLIGVQNISGSCFGNSQTICLNNNLDYCEGFLLMNNDSIFHGFNLNNEGHVEDYTVLSHPETFGNYNLNYIEVTVTGEFGKEGEAGSNIVYDVKVESPDHTPEEITKLIQYVDKVAEVHNTLRKGVPVSLRSQG